MKTIKGFENEDIVVSDFGEWVGKDYIDYKFEYKNNNKIIETLFDENKQLKEKLDKYENPKDMTLMMMWCTEKVKDENKQLKDNWNKLKKDLELVVDYGLDDESSKWDKIYGEYAKSTLKFMQELEQGSDNNE